MGDELHQNDVRRVGDAGSSPALGFGFENFSKSWRELIQKFRLARIKRVAKPSVDLKKQGFSLLNIFINYDIYYIIPLLVEIMELIN